MDVLELVRSRLGWVDPRIWAMAERYLRALPVVKREIAKETDKMIGQMEVSLKPYRNQSKTFARLPVQGQPRADVAAQMAALRVQEEGRWKEGYVSGGVYHGDDAHIAFLNEIYGSYSQTNPLHSDVWPSLTKYESEIVSMTAQMLGATHAPEEICGTVSSGGTESILLAMKAYRDFARERRGIRRPRLVVPVTAHAAFDKACQYFGIEKVEIPLTKDFAADVTEAKRAVNRNTIALVGSTPCFPHGTIDPIEALSSLARERGVGFHTDACLGGFLLPWAKRLGYPVPTFDFSLPGVTSISCDTHKYGYAAKGTSVVLYRGAELRHFQYFTASDWPGGLYCSPTFAGSRPGGLSAACWAAMVSMGESGYLDAAKKILTTAEKIKKGIREIPELRILGDPLFVIAFASDTLDIYRVLDFMTHRRWNLNGLHKPAAVHLCVTLRHAEPGVAERFLTDLKDAVASVRTEPPSKGGMAPAYGMAATLPLRGVVGDMLKQYMDVLYKVSKDS